MADYKEQTVAGKAWQRCHQITIFNPRNGAPHVEFAEERVIAVEGSLEIRQSLPNLSVSFDAARTFPLLDPITGEDTGQSVSYAQAYAILYSAYTEAALARDVENERPEPDMPTA